VEPTSERRSEVPVWRGVDLSVLKAVLDRAEYWVRLLP